MSEKALKPLRVLFVGAFDEDRCLLQNELGHADYDLKVERVDTQQMMAAALERQGWEIVLANDTAPGLSAASVLDLLQRAKADLPVILLSEQPYKDSALMAVRAGFHDFLSFRELKRLLPAIERELRAAAIRQDQKQSQQRYETLVNSVDGIVWDADPQTLQFTFVSRQAERLLGHTSTEWLAGAEFFKNHVHPEDWEQVSALFLKAREECKAQDFEYRMRTADERWLWLRNMVSVSLAKDGNQVQGLQGVMLDITRRKQAEEALRLSEEQFRQAQKMEAIGSMAGGIAHDFNNLLTAIMGYSELTLSGQQLDDRVRGNLEEIRKAAGRAAGLTQQLLAFSRRQVLRPVVLDLNKLLLNIHKMLRRLIGEDIELISVLGTDLGRVKADPGQLEQVIMNLVVNARDAMPGGGRLTLKTSNEELDETYALTHPPTRPGFYTVLNIEDTGVGMDAATLQHIFEPFFTTKEQGRGTGLGLSTVYGIVKQSGGYIWAYSEPGRGTSFKIYLPRVVDEEEVLALEVIAAQVDLPKGTETVLLVEDEEAVRNLVRTILQEYGYTVLEACHGGEALRVAIRYQGTIHLVLTDLVMPLMSGRQLAEKLGRLRPDTKVIFMSGYTDHTIFDQGILDAGTAFLQKPFTPAALISKLQEVLRSTITHSI